MRNLILAVSFISCACSSSYKKTYLTAAATGVAGALYGMSRPEYQSQNAVLYGSIGALTGMAGALVFDLDENGSETLKRENQMMKVKLDEFQKRLEPQLIQKGHTLFSSPLPKEVSGLVEPGEWKRYKMDQWVQDPNQQNIWYRQVEMFEITPPVSR